MGVYCTDLAYCPLNGKKQDARAYLKVFRLLQEVIKRLDETLSKYNGFELVKKAAKNPNLKTSEFFLNNMALLALEIENLRTKITSLK